MPRKARELYPDNFFHLICRSINNTVLFKEDNDFQEYLRLVHFYFGKKNIQCYHYVLMGTHAHFVIKMPHTVDDFPNMMKGIHVKYCFFYQKKYNYEGNLWRDRYRSYLIDTDRYMLGCGLDIEHKPVKAGIVKAPEDYKWSSYRHWVGKRHDALLSEHPLIDNMKNYKDIAEDYLQNYYEYLRLTAVRI